MRDKPQARSKPRSGSVAHIGQGEFHVVSDPRACLGTILGSCVATVIWDPTARVGGLNHLLLPSSKVKDPDEFGHDVNLMERLINGVLQAGADRSNLRAKMFGGAKMIDGLGAAGVINSEFVSRFLSDEAIPCDAQSVGGQFARRLRVWPALGRVQQLRLRDYEGEDLVHGSRRRRAAALKLSGVELL